MCQLNILLTLLLVSSRFGLENKHVGASEELSCEKKRKQTRKTNAPDMSPARDRVAQPDKLATSKVRAQTHKPESNFIIMIGQN